MAEDEPVVRVTLSTIYTEQQAMKQMLAERLPANLADDVSKLKAQVAAQWVVVSIVVVAIGGTLTKVLIGG